MDKKYMYSLKQKLPVIKVFNQFRYEIDSNEEYIEYDISYRQFIKIITEAEILFSRNLKSKSIQKFYYEILNQYNEQGSKLKWK